MLLMNLNSCKIGLRHSKLFECSFNDNVSMQIGLFHEGISCVAANPVWMCSAGSVSHILSYSESHQQSNNLTEKAA